MSGKKHYPWTARRIAALIGIILLLAMYGMTMVFALMGSPESKGLLMGAVFCTIAVPVLLYAMEVAARSLKGRGLPDERTDQNGESSGENGPSADEDGPSANENGPSADENGPSADGDHVQDEKSGSRTED